MNYVGSNIKNVPAFHYGILVLGSVMTESHGYPSTSQNAHEYIWTTDRAEWEKEIAKLSKNLYTNFLPIEANVAEVTTTVTTTVKRK